MGRIIAAASILVAGEKIEFDDKQDDEDKANKVFVFGEDADTDEDVRFFTETGMAVTTFLFL